MFVWEFQISSLLKKSSQMQGTLQNPEESNGKQTLWTIFQGNYYVCYCMLAIVIINVIEFSARKIEESGILVRLDYIFTKELSKMTHQYKEFSTTYSKMWGIFRLSGKLSNGQIMCKPPNIRAENDLNLKNIMTRRINWPPAMFKQKWTNWT